MKIERMLPQFMKDEIKVIGQTFSSYRFENKEEGLYYKCKGEKEKIAFVTGYVQMGLLSRWIHTLEHTPSYISTKDISKHSVEYDMIWFPKSYSI